MAKVIEVIDTKATNTIKYRFDERDDFDKFHPYESETDRQFKLWRVVKLAVDTTLFESNISYKTNAYNQCESKFIITLGHSNKLVFKQPGYLNLDDLDNLYNEILDRIKIEFEVKGEASVKLPRTGLKL